MNHFGRKDHELFHIYVEIQTFPGINKFSFLCNRFMVQHKKRPCNMLMQDYFSIYIKCSILAILYQNRTLTEIFLLYLLLITWCRNDQSYATIRMVWSVTVYIAVVLQHLFVACLISWTVSFEFGLNVHCTRMLYITIIKPVMDGN